MDNEILDEVQMKFFNIMMSMITKNIKEDKAQLIYDSSKEKQPETVTSALKKFALALSISCTCDADIIFQSFKHLLQLNDLNLMNEIQGFISTSVEMIHIYTVSLQKVQEKYEQTNEELNLSKKQCQEILDACVKLLKQIPQDEILLRDKYKSKDKSEKNHQLVFTDLAFLIDYLNRIVRS